MNNCRICPGPACDPEYHEVSARLHAYLRKRLQSVAAPVVKQKNKPRQQPETWERSAVRREPLEARVAEARQIMRDVQERRKAARARKPSKPRRGKGRGKNWLATPGMTQEAIMADYFLPMKMKEIAAKWGVVVGTINERLVRLRKTSPEFRDRDAAAQRCECGSRKRHYQPICTRCRRNLAPRATCSVPGCDGLVKAKGLCSCHWTRQWSAGKVAGAEAETGLGSSAGSSVWVTGGKTIQGRPDSGAAA